MEYTFLELFHPEEADATPLRREPVPEYSVKYRKFISFRHFSTGDKVRKKGKTRGVSRIVSEAGVLQRSPESFHSLFRGNEDSRNPGNRETRRHNR